MYSVKITDTFARETKKLAKKYRHIREDFLPLLDQLESGQFIGDAVAGFENKVYKARVASSDQKKGKSGGFRVIYYIILNDKEILLLTVYAKSKQNDIKENHISEMIKSLGL
ncbi:MAG: type II toxin-antitoxin system RelE/ParE family toxin [Candidatus Electrothrix sp. GW3-4]|uniref:type II toxin-antitoxin system RelE family toxin n=1 Tax=Candidatus Electrothrix sp. GW3-4 TaxID=3126740 RepID=UPI0030CF836C